MSRTADTMSPFQASATGNSKHFQTVKEFCATSGLSCKMIREGCRTGRIPHVRIGEGKNARFMINAKLCLEQLDELSRKGVGLDDR